MPRELNPGCHIASSTSWPLHSTAFTVIISSQKSYFKEHGKISTDNKMIPMITSTNQSPKSLLHTANDGSLKITPEHYGHDRVLIPWTVAYPLDVHDAAPAWTTASAPVAEGGPSTVNWMATSGRRLDDRTTTVIQHPSDTLAFATPLNNNATTTRRSFAIIIVNQQAPQAIAVRSCLPTRHTAENYTTCGGLRRGRARKSWRDNIKGWTDQSLSSLLTHCRRQKPMANVNTEESDRVIFRLYPGANDL